MHSERKIVSILIEYGLHPLQTFQHQTARTGDVDADESFSRGFAIQGTAVDHDFGLMEQLVCEGIAAHAQLTDINPYKISGFQRTDMDGREIGIEEMKEYLVIALQIRAEFIEPVFALIVGCHECLYAKRIDIAYLIDIDGAVYTTTDGGVTADDIGYLKSCCIEGLAGGTADDGIVEAGLTDAGKGYIALTAEGEFAVYLIGEHFYAMTQTNVIKTDELLTTPQSSCGIVGIAEQQDACLVAGTFPLQVLIIHGVLYISIVQRILHHHTTIVADTGEETVVIGCLDDYFIAWHGECLDDG